MENEKFIRENQIELKWNRCTSDTQETVIRDGPILLVKFLVLSAHAHRVTAHKMEWLHTHMAANNYGGRSAEAPVGRYFHVNSSSPRKGEHNKNGFPNTWESAVFRFVAKYSQLYRRGDQTSQLLSHLSRQLRIYSKWSAAPPNSPQRTFTDRYQQIWPETWQQYRNAVFQRGKAQRKLYTRIHRHSRRGHSPCLVAGDLVWKFRSTREQQCWPWCGGSIATFRMFSIIQVSMSWSIRVKSRFGKNSITDWGDDPVYKYGLSW